MERRSTAQLTTQEQRVNRLHNLLFTLLLLAISSTESTTRFNNMTGCSYLYIVGYASVLDN